LLVHGMVIEVVGRWSGSRQAKRSLRWPWKQGENRIRIRKTWGPKPEFHQTANSVAGRWIVFAVRRTVTEGVGKWSGFLMERVTISVVDRARRKSLSGRGHDLHPKAVSAAGGWKEGCHRSAGFCGRRRISRAGRRPNPVSRRFGACWKGRSAGGWPGRQLRGHGSWHSVKRQLKLPGTGVACRCRER
jgi:hypothetical protein